MAPQLDLNNWNMPKIVVIYVIRIVVKQKCNSMAVLLFKNCFLLFVLSMHRQITNISHMWCFGQVFPKKKHAHLDESFVSNTLHLNIIRTTTNIILRVISEKTNRS